MIYENPIPDGTEQLVNAALIRMKRPGKMCRDMLQFAHEDSQPGKYLIGVLSIPGESPFVVAIYRLP